MNRRPLKFITREHELELIQHLETVAEYYDDEKEELMFYFEKFNKHWPIK